MSCSSADFSAQAASPVSIAASFKVLDMVVLYNSSLDTVGGAGLTAMASACIVQTESLAAVVPIPAAFSLDYLDHWMFCEMQYQGDRIVLSPARIEHSLSVLSMRSIGIDRYRSILAAELGFLRSFPDYSPALHFLWHLARLVKLALTIRRSALLRAWARAVPALFHMP